MLPGQIPNYPTFLSLCNILLGKFSTVLAYECSYQERLSEFNFKSQFESRVSADCLLAYDTLFVISNFPDCPLEVCRSLMHPLRMKCVRNLYQFDDFYFSRVPKLWNYIATQFCEFPSFNQYRETI